MDNFIIEPPFSYSGVIRYHIIAQFISTAPTSDTSFSDMKVFLLVIVAFACFIGIKTAPASEDEDSQAKLVIEAKIESFKKSFKSNKYVVSFFKSVDRKCVLEHYKNNSLVEKFLMTSEPQEFPETNNVFELTSVTDANIVFANIAIFCSNKYNALLGFAFDISMSFSNLVEAFKDEEYVKEMFDNLDCLYKYAVDNKFLDLEVYPNITHELQNHTQEECDTKIIQGKSAFIDALSPSKRPVSPRLECLLNQHVSFIEKIFFRYALLITLGITNEQKIVEKSNFIKDTHEASNTMLLCMEKAANDEKYINVV